MRSYNVSVRAYSEKGVDSNTPQPRCVMLGNPCRFHAADMGDLIQVRPSVAEEAIRGYRNSSRNQVPRSSTHPMKRFLRFSGIALRSRFPALPKPAAPHTVPRPPRQSRLPHLRLHWPSTGTKVGPSHYGSYFGDEAADVEACKEVQPKQTNEEPERRTDGL